MRKPKENADQAAADTAAPTKIIHPSQGGSYTRLPDGSLVENKPAEPEAAAETAAAE